MDFSYSLNEASEQGFSFKEETPEDITKLIDNIKARVATGIDRIPARILKDLNQTANHDICLLINLSYRTQTFPSSLKKAIIKPIYKNKGNPDLPEFYRPISILPTISKIFEKSATNQLVHFMESNNKFFTGQHAYRKLHSTTTCLIEVTDHIHQQVDKGNVVGLISTDLSKAFDTLSHDLLLKKLAALGIGKSAISWFLSYLTNRYQRVKLGDFRSSEAKVEAGVPQGSVLGPVLFIAFTSDFHKYVNKCRVRAYADDTQLLVQSNSIDELKTHIEETIQDAQKWYKNNSLKINPTKTEVIIFGSKRNHNQKMDIKIKEGNTISYIQSVEKMKILGVTMDSKLTWEHHIKSVKSKTCRIIANIARTRSSLPLKSRRTLYDALVTPHFNYADVVWDGTTCGLSQYLQKAGNFGARSLLGRKKWESATEALRTLNMMPLAKKREVHLGVMAHKLVNSRGPSELTLTYQDLIARKHGHNTRSTSKGDMRTLARRTSRFDKSTLQRAIKLWNSIPLNIRNTENTSNFKKMFQNHLQNIFNQDTGTHNANPRQV